MIGIHIKYRIKPSCLPGLLTLMGKGILVPIQGGQTLTGMLSDQLGIDPDYLANRVQTIFLNSQPVDDAETAVLEDGDMVALSAAMPGLVGATFRKGGHLAEFRKRISYRQKDSEKPQASGGTVTVRMFNVIAKELGQPLMELGQSVDSGAALSFLKLTAQKLTASDSILLVDGKAVPFESFLNNDFSKEKAVRLSIVSGYAIP